MAAEKTKEQVDAERRNHVTKRISPLVLDGKNKEQLVSYAKELHGLLAQFAGIKYDLEQEYKNKQIDVQELGEKLRQMNKGNEKKRKMSVMGTEDKLGERFPSAPPKVELHSQYERVLDQRSYDDRTALFNSPLDRTPVVPDKPGALKDHERDIHQWQSRKNSFGVIPIAGGLRNADSCETILEED